MISEAGGEPGPEERGTPPAGGPPPRRESPWWASNAAQDPWRDPTSHAWTPASGGWTAPSAPPPAPQYPPYPLHSPYGGPGSGDHDRPPHDRGPRRGLGVVVLVAVVSALLAGGLAGYLGYRAADRHPTSYSVLPQVGGNPGGPSAANRAPESIAGIAKRVLPSVVSIEVSGGGEEGTGSGFVVRSDGFILTNNHVVAPAANGGQLRVVFNDESSLGGTIVGRDPTADIAVVKVDKKGMPALTLGRSSDVAVGDPVVAIGSPLGLAGTVTSGIVSALDRPVVAGGEDGTDQTVISAIQTDAAINPGNSGGPLVNAAGDVVGIDSAIAQLPGSKSGSIGLGFAIPIDQAKRIADELISTGKSGRTYLGASLDNNYDAGDGAKVTTVQGPAAKAGLQAGDLITKIDNKLVTDSIELVAAIRKRPPGTEVSLTYLRGGQQHTVKVTLEETFN